MDRREFAVAAIVQSVNLALNPPKAVVICGCHDAREALDALAYSGRNGLDCSLRASGRRDDISGSFSPGSHSLAWPCPKGLTRSGLCGLLWPDRPSAQARNSLRQSQLAAAVDVVSFVLDAANVWNSISTHRAAKPRRASRMSIQSEARSRRCDDGRPIPALAPFLISAPQRPCLRRPPVFATSPPNAPAARPPQDWMSLGCDGRN